jgi:hypothetical protein
MAVAPLAISTVLISAEQRRTEAAREQEAAESQRADGARLQAVRNLANFHTAVTAFDHMLNRVGMERLAHLLQTEEERKEFLEDILNSYDVFLDEDSDDSEIRHVMGLACQRTASLYRLLGRREAAKKRYGG